MLINNVELEDIDVLDADMAEKYEGALKKVVEDAKEVQETGETSMSVTIRKQCNSVFDCFNSIFGEETDKKVFGNKVNLLVCLKAFEELVEYANEQKKELEKMTNKYSPNRVQRRAAKK